jgi:hypothetical protein
MLALIYIKRTHLILFVRFEKNAWYFINIHSYMYVCIGLNN